jgi:site-specific recombinase XerC
MSLTPQQRAELLAGQIAHRCHPHQLRHAAATSIRARYGLEAAQVILGHAKADVTQVYAERDLTKAHEVMREIG